MKSGKRCGASEMAAPDVMEQVAVEQLSKELTGISTSRSGKLRYLWVFVCRSGGCLRLHGHPGPRVWQNLSMKNVNQCIDAFIKSH